MLKSCPYCGRIHPSGYKCPKKSQDRYQKSNSKADKFRKTWTWQKKREWILKRDFHLCRICNEGRYGDFSKVNRIQGHSDPLQIHHIEPLDECFDRRLDEENLITTCSQHHEMAEAGRIPREYLHELTRTSPRWGADPADAEHQDQQQASEQVKV